MLKLRALRNNKGFTLVEMLVILLIIGVIVAVLVGIMGNPVTQATVDGAVAKTGDDMRALKDAMDLYMMRGNTEPADFVPLLTAGIITQMLIPSANASSANSYTYVPSNGASPRTGFGGTGNDATIELTGVKGPVCRAFNTKYNGAAEGAVPPVAFTPASGSHCFGPNDDTNTIVWPVSVN